MHPGIVPKQAYLGFVPRSCSNATQHNHHIFGSKAESSIMVVYEAMLNQNNSAYYNRSLRGEPRHLPDPVALRHPMGRVVLVGIEVALICHKEIIAFVVQFVKFGLQFQNFTFLLLLTVQMLFTQASMDLLLGDSVSSVECP